MGRNICWQKDAAFHLAYQIDRQNRPSPTPHQRTRRVVLLLDSS